MPKVFENDIIYDYPPVETLIGLFKKYPNPYATHVQSVDTINRSIDTETGVIRTERIIGVQQGAPRWITKLFSLPPVAFVREIVFIDPSAPKATMMSVNLSLAQYVSCLEFIRYDPSPLLPTTSSSSSSSIPALASAFAPSSSSSSSSSSPLEPGTPGPGASATSTLFRQRATLISGFPTAMIARRIENASYDRFSKNAVVGKKGFEWVLSGGMDPPKPKK